MKNEYYNKAVKIAESLDKEHPGMYLSVINLLEMCEEGRMEDYRDGYTHALYMANVISQEERDVIRMACMRSGE